MIYDVIVKNKDIQITKRGIFVENSSNVDQVRFMFDSSWNDLVKFACFKNSNIAKEMTQEDQDLLNSIETFYPNTVLSCDDGVNMDVKYIADSKLYIDNAITQIEKTMLGGN